MNILRLTLLSAIVSLQFATAQTNKRLKDDEAIQTTMQFDTPLPKADAIAQFKSKMELGKGNNYVATFANTDESQRTHEHFQQYYKGIKVEYGVIITHSLNGEVYLINGEAYDASQLNLVPTLSNESALNIILNSKPGAEYLWDAKEDAAALNYKKPSGELVVFPNVKKGTVSLAYKFDIYTTKPLARDEVYVNANTGAIMFSNAIIKHVKDIETTTSSEQTAAVTSVSVTGTANNTKYSGSRQIKTTFNAPTSKYILKDDTRGGGVQTFNSARMPSYPTTNFSDTDNNWTTAEYNNTNKDIGALDAHWGAEMTYDFWKNIFNRDSYDDKGTMLKSYVHYRSVASTSLVNAFWNGSVMSYGDGNTSTSILTSIDVCAHEIGHGICSETANLAYQNQSGALNEGLSDVWGACIEHYGRTGSLNGPYATAVWTIAEDLGISPFRSMSSPTTKGDPSTYRGTNWITTGDEGTCTPSSANDQCGVHTNSGVLNHWFYILTVGKSGTNNAPTPATYSVTGIGMSKSAQITYYAERDYLTPNATFLDMRNATLQVANNLYCGSSPEVVAVTNAWYAVNVGSQYVGYATDISLKKVTQSLSVACGEVINPVVTFENSGTNPITSATLNYSIDGGATISTTWTGSLLNCQSVDLPIAVGALSRGTHSIAFTITTNSDGNTTNNTKNIIVVANSAGVVNSINTFESTTDNLISYDKGNTNNLWQRGVAAGTLLSNTVAGNSKVYGTNLSGLYTDNTTSYLVSPCYDLTNYQNPTIKFDMAFDLETDFDYINVEYSTNGGTTWSILGNATSTTTWYNNSNLPNGTNCENCVGAQWSGTADLANQLGTTNGTKTNYTWSMPEFGYGGTNPQANILFRFNFVSDPGLFLEGVIIDNFVITGTQVLANQQNAFETFAITPNPTNGIINIKLSTTEDVSMELFDLRGRKCFANEYKNTNTTFNQELNLEHLEKGIYLLKIVSGDKTATKKVIIK
jgi:Zn-dependent metalloprotease